MDIWIVISAIYEGRPPSVKPSCGSGDSATAFRLGHRRLTPSDHNDENRWRCLSADGIPSGGRQLPRAPAFVAPKRPVDRGMKICGFLFLNLLLAATSASPADRAPDESLAIRKIERLGGKVVRHDKLPGRPVTIEISGHGADCPFTDDDMPLLAGVHNLTELSLRRTRVTDRGLKQLGKLKSLVKLHLYSPQTTDASMKVLGPLVGLMELYIGRNKITDAGLKQVGELKNLTVLHVESTEITDAGLQEIGKLRKMFELNVSGTRITDAGLSELEDLDDLGELDLSQTRITDAGLKQIRRHAKMFKLWINDTQITDAGLKELAPFQG